MFGVGSLIKSFTKAIGLPDIVGTVLSGIANGLTGNYAALVGDVAELASRIAPNSGFSKLLSTVAPIASAFMGGGGLDKIGDVFKGGGLDKLIGNFKNVTSSFQAIKGGTDFFDKAKKVLDAFQTAKTFVDDLKSFDLRSADAHRNLSLGNIFQ